MAGSQLLASEEETVQSCSCGLGESKGRQGTKGTRSLFFWGVGVVGKTPSQWSKATHLTQASCFP